MYIALRDLILLKKSEDATLCFYEDRAAALEVCEAARISELFAFIDVVSDASDRISRNANIRLTMISLMSDMGML